MWEKKKGEGVGVVMREIEDRMIMREIEDRSMEEIKLTREMEARLRHNKGDILTVKITEDRTEWWVTLVYMGVESWRN